MRSLAEEVSTAFKPLLEAGRLTWVSSATVRYTESVYLDGPGFRLRIARDRGEDTYADASNADDDSWYPLEWVIGAIRGIDPFHPRRMLADEAAELVDVNFADLTSALTKPRYLEIKAKLESYLAWREHWWKSADEQEIRSLLPPDNRSAE